MAGFDTDGKPQIYQVDPSGTYFSWKANAMGGRNFKGMREFLEKEWEEGLDERSALKLTVKTLLEVVDSGSKNMEVVVVKQGSPMVPLSDEELQSVTEEVEKEVEDEKNAGAAEMKD